jgi:hypothetical protein
MSFYGTFLGFQGSTGALFCGAAKIDQVVQPRRKETAAHCHVVRG